MNRRQILKLGGGMGACLISGFGGNELVQAGEKPAHVSRGGKGIAEIRMKSARLEALRRFYEEKLELPVKTDDDQLTVDAGTTRLIFSPTEVSETEPFYHYAFNIPENKIEAARQWQKERTPILRRGNK